VAFNLVDLPWVIAVIGILVGLLLPAVQAACEAVRRTQSLSGNVGVNTSCRGYFTPHTSDLGLAATFWTVSQCSNDLRQVGLAVHLFYNARNDLRPQATYTPGGI